MIGAIAGDIIGSRFEGRRRASKRFKMFAKSSHFTDDTVLTIAIADCILNDKDYTSTIKEYYSLYPNAGYGSGFKAWAKSDDPDGYNSYGNGSAMRISPVVWAAVDGEDVMRLAKETAEVTHNHEEGVKGAQAIAYLGWMAREGEEKSKIRECAETKFGYDIDGVVPNEVDLDCSCQTTVPMAIKAFLDGIDYEETMRLAVHMGGDSDTIACMAATIAEPYYYYSSGMSIKLRKKVFETLDLRLGTIAVEFIRKYIRPDFNPIVEPADNYDDETMFVEFLNDCALSNGGEDLPDDVECDSPIIDRVEA
jgi:ADP-ribosylglycohydrolase